MPVKTIFIWLTFVISILVDQEWHRTTSVCLLVQIEVSEMEDYELEVEGSLNSSSIASDAKGTQEACANDPKWK